MTDISVTELAALADPVVVDVREPYEFDAGHTAGAILIPLGELSERLGEVPREAPVYVICAAGGRSQQGTTFLERNGVDAVNVTGGMTAWQQAGLPTTVDGARS
ncbi:rhodanese-like domain-containing protein [Cryobacterium lactosi]|uniref:Rhodanese-like domain-containing protein n=1 Tax=Cryobacterium lactosi TaxID=1259202 RepID=A0A4R9BW15_9MICO|nr:rhodanese-like domain-containing protein [Cryobacterium lactosi]TFD91031.1 rhodanese-like domain-containing protein [Cryobacterium lactosi]